MIPFITCLKSLNTSLKIFAYRAAPRYQCEDNIRGITNAVLPLETVENDTEKKKKKR